MKTLRLVLLFVSSASAVAFAGGFALDGHGARPTAMGAVGATLRGDPAAAFYNPAGLLGDQGGFKVALGDTLILANLSVTGPSGAVTDTSGMSPPPHLFLSYQLGDRFAAGLGVFVPFGASSDWPDAWEGRFRTTGSSLSVYVINPEVAFKLHDRFRLGGGIQIARATVLLKRDLDFVDSQGSVDLGGATWALGYNVGGQLDVLPGLVELGVSWRSSLVLSVDGLADFQGVPVEFQSRLTDQPVSTTVEVPDAVYFGLAVTPMKNLRLGAEAHYLRWSSFPSLDLNFENPELSSSLAKNWKDTISIHLGAEYGLTDAITVRAGYVYDPSPSPLNTLTPDLPDFTRTKVTLGGGYQWNSLSVDLAYQLVLLSETTSTSPFFPATYSGMAHVIGLTLGYSLPMK